MKTYTEIYNELGKDHFFVGDGKYVDSNDDELRFENIVAKRYAKQFKPKWIKCSDYLPANDKEYLIVNTFESMFIAQYYDGEWIYDDHVFKNITHWMPLPDAP